MSFEKILSDIEKRAFKPIYFLHGEESYYIDSIADRLEATVLQESEKGFNQTILYGKDVDITTILSVAKRYPMMSDFQLVIIKEAQNLKFGKSDSKEMDFFSAYIDNPLKSTILVFCNKYGTVDKRLKWVKNIDKHGVLFESKKLYDNQVPDWAISYLKEKGRGIETKAAAMLADYLGNDLSKISNELDKLILNTQAAKSINAVDIEKNIGISKDFNAFELNTALAKKEVFKAYRIADYFSENKKEHPLVATISTLYSFFSKVFTYHFIQDKSKGNVASVLKVNPFFVTEYEIAGRNYSFEKTCNVIHLLKEYDLRSKGVDSTGNIEEGELLKELIFKILN